MFLLLNLVMITVLMLTAFAAIYVVTRSYIQRDIDDELHRISDFERRPGLPPGDLRGAPGQAPDGQIQTEPAAGQEFAPISGSAPPDRSVSFFVVVDDAGAVTSSFSVFELGDDFYEEAAAAALDQGSPSGIVRQDGSAWAFQVGQRPDGTRVTFLDVSSSLSIINRLVYTFLAVAAVMLVFIFLISKFFADRAIRPIRDAFERQKVFVADASHELRTPLAVINSNVDILLSNADDVNPERARWLHHIKHEAERMTALTSDLLYLAHVDHTGERPEHGQIDLSAIALNAVLTMEAVFFEQGRRICHDIEPGLETIGNNEQIDRVVTVLLDNALKYSSPGGTVTASVKRRHNAVVLSVSNPGEGIPPEHLESVFDRFYRVDSARTGKTRSYGLGLAIARTIVSQHNGRIYAESSPGETTTFFVELPAAG